MLLNFKFSLVPKIIFHSFTVSSDMSKFHQEICKNKDIFTKNGYSEKLIDNCVKKFLNKPFILRGIIQTAQSKQVTIYLPYMVLSLRKLKPNP